MHPGARRKCVHNLFKMRFRRQFDKKYTHGGGIGACESDSRAGRGEGGRGQSEGEQEE